MASLCIGFIFKHVAAIAVIYLSALCRGATHFFLDEKVGKKSRKNDASPLASTAWPAVLSSQRSLDSGRARIA